MSSGSLGAMLSAPGRAAPPLPPGPAAASAASGSSYSNSASPMSSASGSGYFTTLDQLLGLKSVRSGRGPGQARQLAEEELQQILLEPLGAAQRRRS